MSNYMAIVHNSIKENTKVGCDLYLKSRVNGAIRYVLFCRGDEIYCDKQKKQIIEQNIEKLFISAKDYEKYFRYQEKNLQDILTDKQRSAEEKSHMVYNTAKYLVQDLLSDPRSGLNTKVKRASKWVDNTVNYILSDKEAFPSLLKVTTHDYYTYTHSVDISVLALLFGRHVHLDIHSLKCLGVGGLLHDLGKVEIPLDILNKPGKLTKDEFEIVKKHPEIGMEFLKGKADIHEKSLEVVIQHHENYDGTGYPNRIGGNDIHLFGRISRIIDVYDAITTNRCYRRALTPYDALVEMSENMENCFEKELFKEFVCFLGPHSQREK
ncbi:MAG: HD-GYP domain-containing protein [Candidatus Scalinduaceae bacterium]